MFGIHREKDPLIQQLSKDVFSNLEEISKLEDQIVGYNDPKIIDQKRLPRPLSVEDALKELLEMKIKI